jgi:hypothetical protein
VTAENTETIDTKARTQKVAFFSKHNPLDEQVAAIAITKTNERLHIYMPELNKYISKNRILTT